METIKEIVKLLVGLVVFVTGMNLMSNGLKKSAGRSIRRLFKRIANNKIVGALIGAGTTAIIQSSGATTVMVVGFLSMGALTFAQGFSLMLGSFLGTTVTGLFVSLSSFSFSIFLMFTAFIGFILGFLKNEGIKNISEILIGFGILFFGLEAMKDAFELEQIRNAVITILSTVKFPILIMLIGMVLTILTQSSSATNGIVIVMVLSNPSLLSSGFYLVLGATIGALFPTFLAALKSNVKAKRVTYSMIILRTIGALLMTLIIWAISQPLFSSLSRVPSDDTGLVLAIFTIIYNLLFMMVFLPLSNPIEKLANIVIKDKDNEKMMKTIHHISDNLLNTPSVAIIQVKKEIVDMFDLSKTNLFLGLDSMLNVNLSNGKEIEAREDEIDFMNKSISDYLIKLSSRASLDDEAKIGAYYHVINDIERIGDHALNFYNMAKSLSNEDLSFSDIAKDEFNNYSNVLEKMFDLSKNIFMDKDETRLTELHKLEDETDRLKEVYGNNHFERIKKNECNNELSPFHYNLLTELERVADHLTNIGYSIVNPTGDEV